MLPVFPSQASKSSQEPPPTAPLLPEQDSSSLHELSPTGPLLLKQARSPLQELSPTLFLRPVQASVPMQEPAPIQTSGGSVGVKPADREIRRAACRGREEISVGA